MPKVLVPISLPGGIGDITEFFDTVNVVVTSRVFYFVMTVVFSSFMSSLDSSAAVEMMRKLQKRSINGIRARGPRTRVDSTTASPWGHPFVKPELSTRALSVVPKKSSTTH